MTTPRPDAPSVAYRTVTPEQSAACAAALSRGLARQERLYELEQAVVTAKAAKKYALSVMRRLPLDASRVVAEAWATHDAATFALAKAERAYAEASRQPQPEGT